MSFPTLIFTSLIKDFTICFWFKRKSQMLNNCCDCEGNDFRYFSGESFMSIVILKPVAEGLRHKYLTIGWAGDESPHSKNITICARESFWRLCNVRLVDLVNWQQGKLSEVGILYLGKAFRAKNSSSLTTYILLIVDLWIDHNYVDLLLIVDYISYFIFIVLKIVYTTSSPTYRWQIQRQEVGSSCSWREAFKGWSRTPDSDS